MQSGNSNTSPPSIVPGSTIRASGKRPSSISATASSSPRRLGAPGRRMTALPPVISAGSCMKQLSG
jgi:hypothetical protein